MTHAGARAPIDTLEIPARAGIFDARAAGPADGELVLLLHGFPQTSWAWRRQLEALGAAGYRAVAPDQRGYSRRAAPRDVSAYRSEELVADVLEIADHLGAQRFSVVGHDWGGVLAWQLAARHPDHLRTVTVVSTPHPVAFARALRGGDQRRRSAYVMVFQWSIAEPLLTAFDAKGLRALYRRTGLSGADARVYLDALGTAERLRGPLHWYRAADSSLVKGLGRITTPTLYVWGSRDPALGRQAAEATADHVTGPYRFEVLDGVGHWIPEQASDSLNRLLLEHLTGEAAA